jgi:hypothetical protein
MTLEEARAFEFAAAGKVARSFACYSRETLSDW